MSNDHMQTVTKEDFLELFQKTIALAIGEAQKQVAEPLPKELYLGLEAFEQQGKALTVEEIMSFLYRQGTFPRIIDIAVLGIREERTFIWVRVSGHPYVNDFAQTWNTPAGMGPFKIVVASFLLHPLEPVSTQKLKEAGARWARRPRW